LRCSSIPFYPHNSNRNIRDSFTLLGTGCTGINIRHCLEIQEDRAKKTLIARCNKKHDGRQ
jgi:hypothetical protein